MEPGNRGPEVALADRLEAIEVASQQGLRRGRVVGEELERAAPSEVVSAKTLVPSSTSIAVPRAAWSRAAVKSPMSALRTAWSPSSIASARRSPATSRASDSYSRIASPTGVGPWSEDTA